MEAFRKNGLKKQSDALRPMKAYLLKHDKLQVSTTDVCQY